MFKQIVNIIEFPNLYKILLEIKDNVSFEINNYNTNESFLSNLKNLSNNLNNYCILTQSNNKLLINDKSIDSRKLIYFSNFPLRIYRIIETINIKLIRQKYNFQSNINIKNYILNLNSRIILKNRKELKLTEKEIDIILFLNESKKPKNINTLQKEVWGHSSILETHTVETHIYRLRKKIKNTFNDNDFILSHDEGYFIS